MVIVDKKQSVFKMPKNPPFRVNNDFDDTFLRNIDL